MTGRVLRNRTAYIPPQCYTQTQRAEGAAANPCYVCHTTPRAPNYVDDAELQLSLKLPPVAAHNPWSNLLAPANTRMPALSDAALRAYVASSNYLDHQGALALPARLAALPAAWDGDGDARWDGYVPDAFFRFDGEGYDLRPDGVRSGWRAFAYAPLPGTFFPTNGSAGDVLIRLDPALREDERGQLDPRITALNLAIVEALIGRHDVSIPEADEAALQVDLDLDGQLGRATEVRVERGESTRMRYVGRARLLQQAGTFPLAPGLFPLGTEFLHSLRYLDVTKGQQIALAPRMKELRYAKKVRWLGYADLAAHAAAEAIEQQESADGVLFVLWQHDRGIYNGQGWLLSGFIEARDGTLRPQTYEETVFCAGCHGGLGVTTDSMFSFARKLSAPSAGWFHWSQQGLGGLPEPRREDGAHEYSFYLRHNRAGDEYRANVEVTERFFEKTGAVRAPALVRLHGDIASLLLPSAARAMALNRAYHAVVQEQSFIHGRDTVLAPSARVLREAAVDASTGIRVAVSAGR